MFCVVIQKFKIDPLFLCDNISHFCAKVSAVREAREKETFHHNCGMCLGFFDISEKEFAVRLDF